MKTSALWFVAAILAVAHALGAESNAGATLATTNNPSQVSGPIRLGEAEARRLSEQDVSAIQRIATTNGGPAWLVVTSAFASPPNYVEAYSPPRLTAIDLRRGAYLEITRKGDTNAWGPWQLLRKGEYAQVAIPGRELDRISGDQDPNRPFPVYGAFTDEELTSLARFLRMSPAVKLPDGSPIEAGWPILQVARRPRDLERQQPESIEVHLRQNDWNGQLIDLWRVGPAWTVLRAGTYILN